MPIEFILVLIKIKLGRDVVSDLLTSVLGSLRYEH
jgi:hypothetical protein